jgi:hypothetical protein
VEDFLLRSVQQLVARVGDWLTLRFLVQPAIAAILAMRAGVRDARANRPAFLHALLGTSSARRALLRNAWADIAQLFVMAVVVDTLYQIAVLRWVYPLQAVIVAGLLAVVPCAVIRGPFSRLARRGGVV